MRTTGMLAAIVAGALWMGSVEAEGAALRRKTVEAWGRYIQLTEARIHNEINSGGGFLARDFLPPEEARGCEETVAHGGVCVHKMQTLDPRGGELPVPAGMIHHWLGSVLIPNVSLDQLLDWLQDYSKHAERFRDVEASRLLSRKGDRFEIFLRLKQESIVTVEFNTEHVVEYRRHDPRRASSRSVTRRIAELENAGEPNERERPEGNDRGFLWRLNSYWRFQEVPGGVVVECESVALSRSIPFAVRWLVLPFTASIPKDSLESTLTSIRARGAATRMTLRTGPDARTRTDRAGLDSLN